MADEIKPKTVIVTLEPDGRFTIHSYLEVVTPLELLRFGVTFHRIGQEFMSTALPTVRDDAVARY